jgi:hypothetical protein
MKVKLKFSTHGSPWYLTPSVRLGTWSAKEGGFLGLAFLRFDLCLLVWWVEASKRNVVAWIFLVLMFVLMFALPVAVIATAWK